MIRFILWLLNLRLTHIDNRISRNEQRIARLHSRNVALEKLFNTTDRLRCGLLTTWDSLNRVAEEDDMDRAVSSLSSLSPLEQRRAARKYRLDI